MHRLRFLAAVFLFVACLCSCASTKPVVALQPAAPPSAPTPAAPSQEQPRLPFDTGPASASDALPTVVDYAWTPAQLCVATGCKQIDAGILAAINVSENCTESRCGDGSRRVEFRLVKPPSKTVGGHLNQDGKDLGVVLMVGHGSLEDAAKLIDSMGLRPATARELITFAAQHKDRIARNDEVVALGTRFADRDGTVRYATAYCDDDGAVRAVSTFIGPGSRTTFLAAPK